MGQEINRERMERALNFLSETDQEYANSKALYDGLCEQRKIVKANCALRSGESSAAARENTAYTMPDYVLHIQKMETAELNFLTLQAQRNTAGILIDCWRSLNAARSKGQIV